MFFLTWPAARSSSSPAEFAEVDDWPTLAGMGPVMRATTSRCFISSLIFSSALLILPDRIGLCESETIRLTVQLRGSSPSQMCSVGFSTDGGCRDGGRGGTSSSSAASANKWADADVFSAWALEVAVLLEGEGEDASGPADEEVGSDWW